MDRRKKNDYERGSEAPQVLYSPLSYGDNLHYEKFADGSVKCIEDEIPFELPDGWAWSRLSSICVINPKNDLNDDTEVSFIPMPHICEGYVENAYFPLPPVKEQERIVQQIGIIFEFLNMITDASS